MPIQIIDNFELGAAKPLDNRFVVGPGQFYTDKSLIPNKYAGLRVWDLTGGSPGVPYVWDGTAWQTEASSGISGSGTPGYIPKFIGAGVIDDSIIREDSSNIGIGILPTKKLHVNGDVKSDGTGGYYGIGTNLTALNANSITTGILGLARLQNGTSGHILTAGSGSPTWTNPSGITVGNSTNTVNVFHQLDTSTTTGRKIPFINSPGASGNVGLRTSNGFTYQPSNNTLYVQGGIGIGTLPSSSYKLQVNGDIRATSQFFAGSGNQITPSYTFSSDTDTGIYKSGTNTIAISTAATKRVEIGTGLSINSTSVVNKIWVGAISLTYNMGGAGVTSINDYSALPPGWSYTSGNFSSSFYVTGGGFIQLTAPSSWSNTDLVSVSANMRYAGLNGVGGSQDNFGFTITPSINSNGITFYFRRVTAGAAGDVGSIGFMFTAVEAFQAEEGEGIYEPEINPPIDFGEGLYE